MLQVRLAQIQTAVCTLCGHYYNGSENVAGALLFGFYKYGVCLLCGQEVSREAQTHSYKIRWTKMMKEIRGIPPMPTKKVLLRPLKEGERLR